MPVGRETLLSPFSLNLIHSNNSVGCYYDEPRFVPNDLLQVFVVNLGGKTLIGLITIVEHLMLSWLRIVSWGKRVIWTCRIVSRLIELRFSTFKYCHSLVQWMHQEYSDDLKFINATQKHRTEELYFRWKENRVNDSSNHWVEIGAGTPLCFSVSGSFYHFLKYQVPFLVSQCCDENLMPLGHRNRTVHAVRVFTNSNHGMHSELPMACRRIRH